MLNIFTKIYKLRTKIFFNLTQMSIFEYIFTRASNIFFLGWINFKNSQKHYFNYWPLNKLKLIKIIIKITVFSPCDKKSHTYTYKTVQSTLVSYQGCIKTVIVWNFINNRFLSEYILKCYLFLYSSLHEHCMSLLSLWINLMHPF